MTVLVGTSGWSYADWRGAFYPASGSPASRYLTHVRRLRDPGPPVELLMERTAPLGAKRGPILLQLPPDLTVELDRLDQTLSAFGPGVRVAVEVRHPSWDCPETREVLEQHDAALCLTDRRGPGRPAWRTASWGYVRFHAGRAVPEPCYGRTALRSWAGRLRRDWPEESDLFAFFNNDHLACAPRDARRLATACQRAGLKTTRVPKAAQVRLAQKG
jgi:uncharacterized protein YecE (DUF72 family)